jgi:hypothetical protein
MKGIFAILKLIYCGILAHYERNGGDNISYPDFLDAFDNEKIDPKQFDAIFKSFTESKTISSAIQQAKELDNSKKKIPAPKKK